MESNDCITLNTFRSYDIILMIHSENSGKARVGRRSVARRLANAQLYTLFHREWMTVSLPIVQLAKTRDKRSIQVHRKIRAEIRLIRVRRKTSLWKERMFWRPNKAGKSCRIRYSLMHNVSQSNIGSLRLFW